MEIGAITSYIDVAQLMLYAFWIFFFGLIFYLQLESRREGYPLESDDGKRTENHGVWVAKNPKEFLLKHGDNLTTVTENPPDGRELALKKFAPGEGMPFVPTGDPMLDQVGPASYALRADHVDYDLHGEPKIRPLRLASDFFPAGEDDDPRGMTVYGCDNKVAGTISDIWVDTGEFIGRYLEVELADGAGKRLLPWNCYRIVGKTGLFAKLTGIEPRQQGIFVHSITADQFKSVPVTASPDQVTLLEEDKIMGYYGGGKLYATKMRQEPVI